MHAGLRMSFFCCTFAAKFGAKEKERMKILAVIGFVAAAMILLSVGVIFRKDHSFRSQHIHENERMKKDNIHCAITEDKLARRRSDKRLV